MFNDLISELVICAKIRHYLGVSALYYMTHAFVTQHDTDKEMARECSLRYAGCYDPSVHPVTQVAKLVESKQYLRTDIIERMHEFIAKTRLKELEKFNNSSIVS